MNITKSDIGRKVEDGNGDIAIILNVTDSFVETLTKKFNLDGTLFRVPVPSPIDENGNELPLVFNRSVDLVGFVE